MELYAQTAQARTTDADEGLDVQRAQDSMRHHHRRHAGHSDDDEDDDKDQERPGESAVDEDGGDQDVPVRLRELRDVQAQLQTLERLTALVHQREKLKAVRGMVPGLPLYAC
jgi:hypothetical protein